MAERSRRGVVNVGNMKTEQNHERSAENLTVAVPTNRSRAHFLSDRLAYREQPDVLPELLTFGIVVLMAAWPIVLLANAIATGR